MKNKNNFSEIISVRLSPDIDGWLIERINRTNGKTMSDRVRNYLRRDVPDTLPGEPVTLNRNTSWLVGKRIRSEDA